MQGLRQQAVISTLAREMASQSSSRSIQTRRGTIARQQKNEPAPGKRAGGLPSLDMATYLRRWRTIAKADFNGCGTYQNILTTTGPDVRRASEFSVTITWSARMEWT